jgi:hypothetical protein
MAQTNMNIKKHPNATTPVMEFMIPLSEFGMEVAPGDRGNLNIPVEVMAIADDMITFRKMDSITTQGTFRKETANDMRERLLKDAPITDDNEPSEQE